MRNANSNSMLCRLVDLVGASVAPKLVDWYVRESDRFYATRKHPLTLLVKDAEKLHTEMVRWETKARTIKKRTTKQHFMDEGGFDTRGRDGEETQAQSEKRDRLIQLQRRVERVDLAIREAGRGGTIGNVGYDNLIQVMRAMNQLIMDDLKELNDGC